jgi:uncharacterized protein
MNNGKRIMFTSDLHGNINQYKLMLEEANKNGVNGIIIGGDLCPTENGIDLENQREFLKNQLPILLKNNNIPIYIMFGNDDASCNYDIIEKFNGKLWYNIQEKRLKIGNSYIVGYPFIPISSFEIKDYEKFDLKPSSEKQGFLKRLFVSDNLIQPNAKLKGYKSSNEGFMEYEFNKADVKETIENDLNKNLYIKDSENTIYVFHSPPINTSLDLIYNFTHVGSKAIRRFIEQNNILIALSGHVHETVEMGKRNGKKYFEMINNNLCATAGNIHNYNEFSFPLEFSLEFSYLLFNSNNPKETLERKVINY